MVCSGPCAWQGGGSPRLASIEELSPRARDAWALSRGRPGFVELRTLRRAVASCDPSSKIIVLHVAKMVYAAGVPGAHADDIFVGFGRVFCGSIRPGSGGVLHVLDGGVEGAPVTIEINSLRLYVLMGRELVQTDHVDAGGVCGIGGLAGSVKRSSTLCSDGACPPFAALATQSAPVVQVALEPTSLAQMAELERGLLLLGRSDWSVDVAQVRLSRLASLRLT